MAREGLANKRTFVPSQKQLERQLKFGLMMRFLQPMSRLLEISFHDFAIRKTAINCAFKYNFKEAITGDFPDYAIDYSKALVSKGSLPNVLRPTVVSGAGSVVTWSWTDNNSSTANPNDEAILVAYCPTMKQAIFTASSGVKRSDLTGDLNLLTFSGQAVETYIGFLSADGYNAATSIFTGQVNSKIKQGPATKSLLKTIRH